MPTVIAPEHFQTEQCFVALLAPKLSWSLEPALGLPTSGFHWAAADGFARPAACSVIHAGLMFVEVSYFFGYRLRLPASGYLLQRLLQLAYHFDGGLVL